MEQGKIPTKQRGFVRQRGRRGERAQSLVEFAVILPIFLILLCAIVDFSMGLKAWITITNSAREGARYAAVTCATPSADEDDVILRAVNTAAALDNVEVDVDNCPGSSEEFVVVTVEYEYELITPLAGMLSILHWGTPASLTLKSVSDMRLE